MCSFFVFLCVLFNFQFEVREDEEQSLKLTQTIELLLAAGYFRARIKGLSPFDKVVGGMTWCITTCSFDLNVDLLFQENSNIGQKIALTEKIVAVLPRMKCPHRIEPHQIQGLDFIHIFPVVQWLVKKAIETREELGDFIRSYSISQFQKHHTMPQDVEVKENKEGKIRAIRSVSEVYQPKRKYRRHETKAIADEVTRVHCTLLEYGRRFVSTVHCLFYLFSISLKDEMPNEKKSVLKEEDKKKEEKEREEEEKRLSLLMRGMSSTDSKPDRLTAGTIGSLVGLQSAEIQQTAAYYADKQSEIDRLEKSERGGGVEHHKRQIISLGKQIESTKQATTEIEGRHAELQEKYLETKKRYLEAKNSSQRLNDELEHLAEIEQGENKGVLETLRSLVAENERLKRQEAEFRAQCKEELAKLQADIEAAKEEGGVETPEDKERNAMIAKQYQADREKLGKIKLLFARKNREISSLQRKIDEVPTRAELSQYQRRFVELYGQIAAKHKETKQFYTLYNTLDDTKLYLNKEVNLLNSIYDTFEQAMSSTANKEQFLKQFEQIVDGVKQNRLRVERKRQEEKMRRDQLNDEYLDLVEKQRHYFKTVKEFKEECRKNEILLSKLQLH
ncbi:hypothetical protein CAPTEDRAFT_184119 [Capitella teleta]|uniref:Coiled-coil domain-containing protein 93 n=1 Tax=Capitella teleta TaxID=283909 RepID=R7UHS3_CAPTE|nr:hypothetical protein CAPTEDRAFT_184119 [Capitella teleta]|eukprot:ELU05628.1 hypothetical protein CAPTEDRAFT_184119 [Capitella teleta]